ncbi:MAG: ATP-binding cassette domain-containing protein [Lachnospirales bacterium]
MNNVVEVRGVYKKFGQETVLENVNLDLSEGAIHGIVGRNGSGKTVLMKCILGFLQPTRGEITVFGKQIGRDCDFAPHTGMMIETPGFMDTESGLANLRYLRRLTAQNDTAISPQEAMKVVGLDPGNKKHVGKYSLGMRQRLGIAQAIMEGPRLLILDEPMNGLDNQGVEDMRRLLLDFRNRGVTILLASHNPLDVSLLCDQVFTIDGGILRRQ